MGRKATKNWFSLTIVLVGASEFTVRVAYKGETLSDVTVPCENTATIARLSDLQDATGGSIGAVLHYLASMGRE